MYLELGLWYTNVEEKIAVFIILIEHGHNDTTLTSATTL